MFGVFGYGGKFLYSKALEVVNQKLQGMLEDSVFEKGEILRIVYNDNDLEICRWLENLMKAKEIPQGQILTKDIKNVSLEDLEEMNHFHAFAGIGTWAFVLYKIGWPRNVPVWTGSCPCQPFSMAGKREGETDERHLWPIWRNLIEEKHPPIVFGEQVASPDGRCWLSSVQTDLENLGYQTAAADLCAAGVGSPIPRQRLFFMAVSNIERCKEFRLYIQQWKEGQAFAKAARSCETRDWKDFEWLLHRDNRYRPIESSTFPLVDGLPDSVPLLLPNGKEIRYSWKLALRGIGNSIVPRVAEIFIKSSLMAIAEEE